jgi:hypothetical protein
VILPAPQKGPPLPVALQGCETGPNPTEPYVTALAPQKDPIPLAVSPPGWQTGLNLTGQYAPLLVLTVVA